jgi:hypothetical protein
MGVVIIPKPAHAYLDPGSGSYLIQVIVAFSATFGYLLKSNWNVRKIIFKNESSKKKP